MAHTCTIDDACASANTHLWKQTSMFGRRTFEFVGSGNTFTLMECANFPKFLNLDSPCIWTLSTTTVAPGLEAGEFPTGKPRDSCSVEFWVRPEKEIRRAISEISTCIIMRPDYVIHNNAKFQTTISYYQPVPLLEQTICTEYWYWFLCLNKQFAQIFSTVNLTYGT